MFPACRDTQTIKRFVNRIVLSSTLLTTAHNIASNLLQVFNKFLTCMRSEVSILRENKQNKKVNARTGRRCKLPRDGGGIYTVLQSTSTMNVRTFTFLLFRRSVDPDSHGHMPSDSFFT